MWTAKALRNTNRLREKSSERPLIGMRVRGNEAITDGQCRRDTLSLAGSHVHMSKEVHVVRVQATDADNARPPSVLWT